MKEPRFFIDHDCIHDRLTGRHIHGDRSMEPGIADEAVAMLNELNSVAASVAELQAAISAQWIDAKRYRWLRSQRAVLLESDQTQWERNDGTKYQSSHRLCANDTQFASYETLDATIDAAMRVCKP